jgi:predicted alpha/beta superfamily hydrolase
MGDTVAIRVHYPLESGRIVMRTEDDWERDVEPVAQGEGAAGGTRWDFNLPLARPYLYFKPVLRRDGEAHWAQGENHLVLRDGRPEVDVYPFFFSDTACTVCALSHLPSKTAPRRHALRVFTPPGYEENTLAAYPVLYMQDGQNLFFPSEAFNGHHWMIDETLRILGAMNLVRRAIVVGIYPQERVTDYTRPGYEEYGRYLVEEVKPWVDARFRTLTGPRQTAVMGSSLGGVVSLHLAWSWPEVFGFAGCLSSTFAWRDDLMERIAAEEKRPLKIYLDSGWPRDNYEVTRAMHHLLLRRGYREGEDLMYLAFPNARHDEQAWSMRAHIPFQFFFAD